MADKANRASQGTNAVERLRIGHEHAGEQPHELGVIALRDGQIAIEKSGSDDDRQALARLVAGMFHGRYADEAALFHSLPHRLNNGYLYCHPVQTRAGGGGRDKSSVGLKKTGPIRPTRAPRPQG